MGASVRAAHVPLALRVALLLSALVLMGSVTARNAVAEGLSSADMRLNAAVGVIAADPATSHLPEVLAVNGIRVAFVQMAPSIYARYSTVRKSIEIDQRWESADVETLAAVIAHEAVHAEDAVNGYLASGAAPACIGSEVRAFRTAATLWLSLYGPQGKPSADDELVRQLNLIAQRQLTDPTGLEQLVRQAYVDQCGS